MSSATDSETTNNEQEKETAAAPPKKIKVHFVAVGNAPILKKSKFLMSSEDEFGVANSFLRRLLKLSDGASNNKSVPPLFLYVNAAFVPSVDQRMGDLIDCFGVRGELVIHYSLMEAWG
jgi:ubiquitin-like protein ATG12